MVNTPENSIIGFWAAALWDGSEEMTLGYQTVGRRRSPTLSVHFSDTRPKFRLRCQTACGIFGPTPESDVGVSVRKIDRVSKYEGTPPG